MQQCIFKQTICPFFSLFSLCLVYDYNAYFDPHYYTRGGTLAKSLNLPPLSFSFSISRNVSFSPAPAFRSRNDRSSGPTGITDTIFYELDERHPFPPSIPYTDITFRVIYYRAESSVSTGRYSSNPYPCRRFSPVIRVTRGRNDIGHGDTHPRPARPVIARHAHRCCDR